MMALCFSIFTSAIQKLISPEKLQEADLVLIVGGVGFVVNLIGIGVFLNETLGDMKKNKEKVEETRNENCPQHGTNSGLANPAFTTDNNNVDIANNNIAPQTVVEPKPSPPVKTRKLSVTSADFPQNWQHERFSKIGEQETLKSKNDRIWNYNLLKKYFSLLFFSRHHFRDCYERWRD